MSSSDDHAPHLSETSARQGRWGRPVFRTLIFSLSLAVLAMIGVWVWHAERLSAVQHNARAPASDVARYGAPPPHPPPSS